MVRAWKGKQKSVLVACAEAKTVSAGRIVSGVNGLVVLKDLVVSKERNRLKTVAYVVRKAPSVITNANGAPSVFVRMKARVRRVKSILSPAITAIIKRVYAGMIVSGGPGGPVRALASVR